MCFQLYAATSKPLPRRKWELGSSQLPVKPLAAHDATVKAHFSNPEVQFIGSTSGCGCDFPYVIFQNGGWPYYEDPEDEAEAAASNRLNCEGLVNLLRSTGDSIVELYGIWEGHFGETPKIYETISLETILNPDFRFKEQGFYKVRMIPT
jgi:hypothetical protein